MTFDCPHCKREIFIHGSRPDIKSVACFCGKTYRITHTITITEKQA